MDVWGQGKSVTQLATEPTTTKVSKWIEGIWDSRNFLKMDENLIESGTYQK